MKMTKLKLRSFRMKQVNSETGGELPTASIVQLSSAPSNENEYWSDVEFSIDINSYFLTYTNKRRDEFAYSYFDHPFYAGGQPKDRPKITDIKQLRVPDCLLYSSPPCDDVDDCNDYCDYYYDYQYNGKKISTYYDDSGVIEIKMNITSNQQPKLPLRFIIIAQNDDGEDDNYAYNGDLTPIIKGASYFYVDVDIDQNVNLSK
jgi:hypothetical protein